MGVAGRYDTIQPGQLSTRTIRVISIIDPQARIRAILYYPPSTGRDSDEIKRIILALQKADQNSVVAPANWRPDDGVIVPMAGSCGITKEQMEGQNEDQCYLDWFICFRRENK